MDQTTTTLIIINLLLNFLQVLDHFLTKIKRSKCLGGELEMNSDSKDNKDNQININKNNDLEQNKILEQLKILTNQKQQDDNKIDNTINKL